MVGVRVDRAVADMLPADAQFWVVRPEVSTSGITGLSTVLSGVYIQAAFVPEAGQRVSRFTGLETAPLVLPGTEGTKITIRSSDGSKLTAGAPISYQGLRWARSKPRV